MLEPIENRADAKWIQRLLPWLLALVCLLIALVFVLQSLLASPPSATATQLVQPDERSPLLLSLRAQQPIVWSTLTGTGALLLALLLAVSPLTWWMRLWAAFGWGPSAQLARLTVQQQEQQAMEQWIAEQAALYAEQTQPDALAQPNAPPAEGQVTGPQQPVAGQPPGMSAPGTQPPGVQAPGTQAPGAPPQPGAQPAAQPPGVQPPGAQPPGQPGAPPEQPVAQQPGAQPPAPQPTGAPLPAASSEALQALLVEEETLDLAELTDIGDLLNSFKESEGVSPQLLALSQSLDEVDVTTLVAQTRQLAATLAAGKRR